MSCDLMLCYFIEGNICKHQLLTDEGLRGGSARVFPVHGRKSGDGC